MHHKLKYMFSLETIPRRITGDRNSPKLLERNAYNALLAFWWTTSSSPYYFQRNRLILISLPLTGYPYHYIQNMHQAAQIHRGLGHTDAQTPGGLLTHGPPPPEGGMVADGVVSHRQ